MKICTWAGRSCCGREPAAPLPAAADRRRAVHTCRRGHGMNDTPFAALMQSLGYPGPHEVNTGRTIWSESKSILTNRTCSAFWGPIAVSSPEIRKIVHEVHTRYLSLPEALSPAQQEQFLDQEANRISRLVADLAAELGEQAIVDWQNRNGQPPDFTTKTGLLNSARASAMEIVLHEQLYEKIPQEPEAQQNQEQITPPVDRAQLPWDQRWTRTAYRTDPDETLEALAETVWPDPDFSVVFRIKAGYLLAARAEDGQPLPSQPGEDLAAELAKLVYADLKSDGLPER